MSETDPRVRAARAMRADGVLVAEIAERFGVAPRTIYRWMDSAYLERDRQRAHAWKERNRERNRARDRAAARTAHGRGVCEGCGMPKGIRGRRNRQCQACIHATAEVRRTLAEGMWADGWTCGEMADAFGVCAGYFAAQRPRGWNLPHRRTPEQVERIRAAVWGERAAA